MLFLLVYHLFITRTRRNICRTMKSKYMLILGKHHSIENAGVQSRWGVGGGGTVFMISYMSMCGFKGYQFLSRFWSESLKTGMDSRKPGLKMDIAKLMFWSEIGSGFRELSHTPSPKIPRSTCDLNARFQSNFLLHSSCSFKSLVQ